MTLTEVFRNLQTVQTATCRKMRHTTASVLLKGSAAATVEGYTSIPCAAITLVLPVDITLLLRPQNSSPKMKMHVVYEPPQLLEESFRDPVTPKLVDYYTAEEIFLIGWWVNKRAWLVRPYVFAHNQLPYSSTTRSEASVPTRDPPHCPFLGCFVVGLSGSFFVLSRCPVIGLTSTRGLACASEVQREV